MGLLDHLKSSAFGSSADASTASYEEGDAVGKDTAESGSVRALNLGKFSFDSNDGYTYPSLFEEADDMIKLSNLIYTLIELRELARSGALDEHKTSLKILELPLPMDQALSIVATEAEVLKKYLSDGAHEEALSALQALAGPQLAVAKSDSDKTRSTQQNAKDKSDGLIGGLLDMWKNCFPGGIHSGSPEEYVTVQEYNVSTIISVGDEKCQEELVYVVGINPANKRVTVAFRGSTTKNDFVTDARMDMIRVTDPRAFAASIDKSNKQYSEKEIESNICIHQGFYEYLFGVDPKKQNKFDEIMGHVQKIFDSNPNYRKEYKLYVTGHSLGGALATLFGFYASAFSSLPGPVTIISVASPRVGNLEFAQTFTEFESQGKIRHCRIANHKDPVTLGPTVSSKRALTLATMMFSPLGYAALKLSGRDVGAEETYYHTGIKMKLRKEVPEGAKQCELSYSGASFLQKELKDEDVDAEVAGKKSSVLATSDVPLVSYHFGAAYSERIAMAKSDLEGLTLNQLYIEKAR